MIAVAVCGGWIRVGKTRNGGAAWGLSLQARERRYFALVKVNGGN